MKNRSRRIVLIIVEGVSDKDSLELLIKKAFSHKNFIFEVVNGDITANKDTTTKNIKEKLTNIIKSGGRNKYKPSDYEEIIHLIDIDGVFLDNEHIYVDPSLKEFSYKEDGIYFSNVEDVIKRNESKRNIIKMLVSTKSVYNKIPYSIYFFSSNLEHVLHNLIDPEDSEKINLANNFQDKYFEDIEGFLKFMCESEFSVNKNYKEGWEYIMGIKDKIIRASNFNLIIEKYKDN